MDYFNKMAELVFVAVFNTHMCRKQLTKRQKFKCIANAMSAMLSPTINGVCSNVANSSR